MLTHAYADALPELTERWESAEAPEPRLVLLNEELAVELGLDPDWLRSPEGLGLLTGEHPPAGSAPVAQAYAGHQFGGWSPRLGDGRALLLGELADRTGRLRDLHLKGSGPTRFARGGDGYAALAPMLREYVVSEAMHALGVPTTRSLAVVATGRGVVREQGVLPGAVLARVASSHLRVGTFQYARTLDDPDLLKRLADHAIARHHPEAARAASPYLALFQAVRDAWAHTVADWMGVGFVHGVMNTDNVTISGETIDYGPCAFLDAADPATVFSSIDHGGRYAFGNQPGVTAWNLARFAESLLGLIADDQDEAVEVATASLQEYGSAYVGAWHQVLRRKLGLTRERSDRPEVTDDELAPLAEELAEIMASTPVDHTGFWRDLTAAATQDGADAVGGAAAAVRGRVLELERFDAWLGRWRALGPEQASMRRANPVVVPRNHLVEEALEQATGGDLAALHRLLEVVTTPYRTPEEPAFAEPAPASFGAYTTFCGT